MQCSRFVAAHDRFGAIKHTHSEQDWAWVLSELDQRKGCRAAHAGARFRRSDKPNPLYYAQRTVDMASARLALLAGSLHSRRNHHARGTPLVRASRSTLLRSCAGDCATTAARMIARKKLA